MKNKKLKNTNIKLSIRLYDEQFNVIFGLTKEDMKEGLKQIDEILRLKFDSDIEEFIRKGKKKNG